MRLLMFLAVLAGFSAVSLRAQDSAELLNRMKAMEDRIKSLEGEVSALKAAAMASTPAPPPPAGVAPGQPSAAAAPMTQEPTTLGGAGGAAAKALNPDISVIGDFIGAAGNGANRGIPSLEMHESEVGFQEVIDPYARADFFLSFGEHGVDLEEGYLTFTSLPAGLQLKVGKMRAAFGKVNTLHNHVLPWADRPLVSQNLVGGEDGINDAGLSLSRILPAPKGLFLEGTAQIFRGDSDNVFRAVRRSDVSAVGHLRAYRDLSESTNLDFGGSYARGHSPFGDGTNQLFGGDVTLRWKPLRRAIYHSFVAPQRVHLGADHGCQSRDPEPCARLPPSRSAITSRAIISSAGAGSWAAASTAPSVAPACPPIHPLPPYAPTVPISPICSRTPAAPCC